MTFRPADFGAVGDGVHDDAAALEATCAAAVAAGDRARIDLTGKWSVGRTVRLTTPPRAHVTAGRIEALPAVVIPGAIVELDLGATTRIRDTLEVFGPVNAWLVHRTAGDAISVINANRAVCDGFAVGYVRRDGLRVASGNAIGASLGHVTADFCGTPGHPSAPPHTRATSTATEIVREGLANSPSQRALVYCVPPTWVQSGDQITIGGRPYPDGGSLVTVIDVVAATPTEGSYLRVYPWPGRHQGVALGLPIESLAGAGVRLIGGNTSQVGIDYLAAGYCGVGLAAQGIYGVCVGRVVAELVGIGLGFAMYNGTHRGSIVQSYHPELTTVDVAQLGLSVYDCRILTAVATRRWLWHLTCPTLTSGISGPWVASGVEAS